MSSPLITRSVGGIANGDRLCRDVAIVSGKQNEELQKQGKLLVGSRVEIAQVGFTVFVKKGAAKPDLMTPSGA
jgi:hypothetical protein